MKKAQKKRTLRETLHLYRTIAGWNGESANDLVKAIRRLAEAGPTPLLKFAAMQLHRFRTPANMRFDYSELREPVLAVDKKGFALVGTLYAPKVLQLARI